ncbi:hypothetical protein BDV93DRAFT_516178 [Ceratobasidium sp. AG-I]|nr:hypothetical protein BDV93DRAFT_516178 [Ceratobasidium sp. AG-I]
MVIVVVFSSVQVCFLPVRFVLSMSNIAWLVGNPTVDVTATNGLTIYAKPESASGRNSESSYKPTVRASKNSDAGSSTGCGSGVLESLGSPSREALGPMGPRELKTWEIVQARVIMIEAPVSVAATAGVQVDGSPVRYESGAQPPRVQQDCIVGKVGQQQDVEDLVYAAINRGQETAGTFSAQSKTR